MEVAIFGGTFDPPTLAHEAIIEACLERPDIDEVWLMPSGVREDKGGMQSDEVRLQMLDVLVKNSFEGADRLLVSEFELALPRPTNTAATYDALVAAFPDRKFWFVFGADSYHTMPTWEQGDYLHKTLGMLLVERAGYELPEESSQIKHLKVKDAKAGISSTAARQAFSEGKAEDAPVSPVIRNFITKRGLYSRDTIDG